MQEAAWNKTIYVSPSGNDSQGCGHWAKPCKSLDTAFTIAFNGGGSANSTLISAAKGNYTLAKSFNITNVDTFALVGQGSRSDEYGDNVVNVTRSQHDSFQHNNTYVFRNCYFLRNEAFGLDVSSNYDLIDDPGPTQFSLGGGLAINFRGNASNCKTKIESCVFTGNQAVWGGGLQVETRDEVTNNHFTIKNTTFYDNTGILAGGGVRVGNIPERGADFPLNTFTFDNSCTFVNNSAFWGGGMSVYGTSILCKMNCDIKHITQFTFNNCTWSDNNGTVGAGLVTVLNNQNEVEIGPEMPFSISFKDCSFLRNQVVKLDKGVMIGEGAIYSDQVPLIFRRKTSFISNIGTALSLDGSTIEIYDHVEFINNTGYLGGAVAMRGQSRMIFQKNSKLLFKGNSCERKGGALFIHPAGSPLVVFNATGIDTHECFFGYEDDKIEFKDWKTSVIFQGNRAIDDGKGNSVYATTLTNCRRPGESRRNNTVLLWDFIQFKKLDGNVTTRENEVATDAIGIFYEKTDWEVAPGELFNATVKLIDEIGNSVNEIIDVNIVSPGHSVKLNTSSPLFLTADGNISYLRLAGKPGSLFSVSLRYVGIQVLVDTITDISLQNCHAGFVSHGSSCDCIDSADDGVRCDSDGKTFYLKKGYWAGKVKDEFVTHLCPADYCNFKKSMFPDDYQYISGEVCKGDRDQTSVLCGQCKPGYTVLFGSENCSSSCTDLWAWAPIVVVLLIVNCFVLSFSPNLASGHLNACLYSYQIMKILTPEGFEYGPVIEFLAALSNFQLGIGRGFCLASGLDNADKLMVMVSFPVVEIFILAPLIKTALVQPIWGRALQKIKNKLQCNPDNPDDPGNPGTCCCRNPCLTYLNCCSESFNERVRNGFTRSFCTIIVLCYVDITHISLQLLNPAIFRESTVLFADGNMEFFVNTKHIVYGCIAGVLMVFVICFPVVLIFYPVCKNQNLETLRACYKTRRHFFVAYYLGCRVLLLVISTYVPAGPLKSALLQLCCILILFIIAAVRPYKEANEAGEAQGVATQGEAGEAQGGETQGEAGEAQGEETQGEAGVATQGGNEAGDAPRVATHGGNEAGEAQGVANQGGDEAQEAGEETVENKWINKSDTVILTTLSAIAVLSSPIGSDVPDSTRSGLMWAVRILAWVPLVMAFLPYALRHLRPRCCTARDNHVPERQRAQQRGVPNEPDPIVNERTPLLDGAQQRGVPNEPDPNVNKRTPLLDGAKQRGVPNEPDPNVNERTPLLDGAQQRGVPNEPDPNVNERIPLLDGAQQRGVPNEPDPIVNEPTPPLGGAQQRGVPSEPDPNVNERAPLLDGAQQRGVPNEPDPIVNEPTLPLGGAQQRGVPNESDPQKNADEFDTTVANELFDTAADELFATAPEPQDVSNGPDGDLEVNLRTPVGADNDGTHKSKNVIV
ncbi:hypothetical protein OS493_011471 [Desmophyllum pertusum]|uniref:Uncharacterized protein n=1 Tax=Desmophyllum pertusum TaxID=174260 RepID=A0A9X0CLD7_9CNID|nr:hypothetical protein OS493_011471 [Desmophyllum pertusum]